MQTLQDYHSVASRIGNCFILYVKVFLSMFALLKIFYDALFFLFISEPVAFLL